MKALIRPNEILLETQWPEYIERNTGMPLTNSVWAGGPYTLVDDYIPPAEDEVTSPSNPDTKRLAEIAELKARLAALENNL